MDFLFQIPVLGVVFQLAGYLVDIIPGLGPSIVRFATPLALGALCGLMCERSGIVNIGIEGLMLLAAFFAFVAAGFVAQSMPAETSTAIFGVTPALLLGLLAGIVVAMIVSALHAWLSISIRADQIISGTIINIAAFGITGYLNNVIAAASPTSAGQFTSFTPPDWLTSIPVVGWIFETILAQGPITFTLLISVVVLQLLLFRSRWGLRTRAVGEHPKAAETVGINVIRVRYRNVILGGIFAGLAGAFLTLESQGHFQLGLTAGRGFIALAAVIVGRWTPIGAFAAAILFAATDALRIAIGIAPPTGELGTVFNLVPAQFYQALPYIVTIVVLAGVVGRSTPPAADGQPYQREAVT
jgi:simple sugar transport system permease protein